MYSDEGNISMLHRLLKNLRFIFLITTADNKKKIQTLLRTYILKVLYIEYNVLYASLMFLQYLYSSYKVCVPNFFLMCQISLQSEEVSSIFLENKTLSQKCSLKEKS